MQVTNGRFRRIGLRPVSIKLGRRLDKSSTLLTSWPDLSWSGLPPLWPAHSCSKELIKLGMKGTEEWKLQDCHQACSVLSPSSRVQPGRSIRVSIEASAPGRLTAFNALHLVVSTSALPPYEDREVPHSERKLFEIHVSDLFPAETSWDRPLWMPIKLGLKRKRNSKIYLGIQTNP